MSVALETEPLLLRRTILKYAFFFMTEYCKMSFFNFMLFQIEVWEFSFNEYKIDINMYKHTNI